MRTQFGNIPLMTLLAASLTAGSGCSDLTLGQIPPPKGGPKLERITVQDYAFVGGPPAQRGGIVDLLDNTPPVACAVNNPCVTQFLIAQTFPDLSCQSNGFCLDPLKLTSAGVPLNIGATAIRIVFNKQLQSNLIQTIKADANGAQIPGQTMSLNSGVLELLDQDGTNVPVTGFWDNSGATTFTSDVIWIPFGPAIVTNPMDLNPNTTYTIRLHTTNLKDVKGEAATDANGVPLPEPYEIKFTTEQLTPNLGADGDYSGTASMPTVIAPNDVVQFPFFEDVDETTAALDPTSTGPTGFVAANVEIYNERGSDPTMCMANEDPFTLNLVYTSGTGAARAPADWPAGDYSLVLNVKSAAGNSSSNGNPIIFTVSGADTTDPTMDAGAVANHVTPEQCK